MTIREIRCCVVRYQGATVMANAFRAALSIPQIWVWPKRNVIVSTDRFDDIHACFSNASSPMDGRS